MKRYIVFVYEVHSSLGGINDSIDSVQSFKEAYSIIMRYTFSDQAQILDVQTGKLRIYNTRKTRFKESRTMFTLHVKTNMSNNEQ